LTRSELSESVWGQEYSNNTRTVDVHVGRLRRKLGKTATVSKPSNASATGSSKGLLPILSDLIF
jgi:hypothetical protein